MHDASNRAGGPAAAQFDLFGGAASGARPRGAPADPQLAALAARVPPGLRLGTSSWSFPGWRGIVYDATYREADLAREGLAAYAESPLLRSVGVDRGFYAPVPRADLDRWAREVPAQFRFLVKAHAALTTPADAPRPAFLGRAPGAFLDARYACDAVVGPAAQALGVRLGAILFQFSPLGVSPSGSRWLRDPAPLHDALQRFLEGLPAGPTYAIEWRDAAPLGGRYGEVLRTTGAVHCAAAHPRLPAPVEQFVRAPGRPGSPRFVRWLLHRSQSYEGARARYAPFDRMVDPDPGTREAIAGLCAGALADGREATVIANNKAEGSAPLTLRALAARICGLTPAAC